MISYTPSTITNMSLFNFQQLNLQIKDKLFEISYKTSCFNKSGFTDISKYAEAYFRLLLNVIYKEKKWFFEKAVKINQDTYDLYDQKNKVCIQITSNFRNSKKLETIKSFEAAHFGKGYETLIILFISDSKPKPDKLHRKFKYIDYNITEFSSLIEGSCNQKQLLEIRDILNETFDFERDGKMYKSPNNKKVSAREFLRRQKIEKELRHELVIPDYWNKIDGELLIKEPFRKFKDSRFILRSINDETYPGGGMDADWSRTFMYDFYERGILIEPAACINVYAAIDEKGYWYILEFDETDKELPPGSIKEEIKYLAKLPFKNIISWKDGDDYYNDYHLFCKYDGIDKSPYEQFDFFQSNETGYFKKELEKSKKIDR